MFWDEEYKDKQRVWGEGPGELAVITVEYLRGYGLSDRLLDILDVGCGYGRDVRYLSANLNCNVTGVDSSEKAVGMARSNVFHAPPHRVGADREEARKMGLTFKVRRWWAQPTPDTKIILSF